MIRNLVVTGLIALMLAGCVVGPDGRYGNRGWGHQGNAFAGHEGPQQYRGGQPYQHPPQYNGWTR